MPILTPASLAALPLNAPQQVPRQPFLTPTEKVVILLAEDGQAAIGKVGVAIGRRGDTGRLGYMGKLVVLPEHRGKGLATTPGQ